MADDRRAALAEAFAKHSAQEDEIETPALDVEAPTEVIETPAAEVEAVAPTDAPPPDETPAQKAERERDPKGRFAPKVEPKTEKPAKPDATPVTAKPTEPQKPVAPVAPQAPVVRAPQSLRAAAREAWNKAPPEMRPLLEDVARLEGEAKRVIQENAGLRKSAEDGSRFKENIDGFVRPFEGIFRARGFQNSMDGVANVVNTYAALHYAAPQQKAEILAGLISEFSTVDDINAAMERVAAGRGQQPQQQWRAPPQQQQAPVDPRQVFREEIKAFQEQAILARETKNYDAFLASEPEFINSPGVQESMQTILDSAATRGRNLTYQQAYDLALKMDGEIQGILEQREAAAKATLPTATATTVRAKAAAATVRTKPASAVGDQVDPKDRRALLEQNFRRSTSR